MHTTGQQAPFPKDPLTVFVITVSDSCSQGLREDLSGPALAALLTDAGLEERFMIVGTRVVPDEQSLIEDALQVASRQSRLVVTTGGTGLTRRDVTPEATRAVCDRLLDGLSEQMRTAGLHETPFAVLSRGVCGLVGSSLVINVPGSPRGAVTSLRAVLPVLPHALRLLVDASAPHPAEPQPADSPRTADVLKTATTSAISSAMAPGERNA